MAVSTQATARLRQVLVLSAAMAPRAERDDDVSERERAKEIARQVVGSLGDVYVDLVAEAMIHFYEQPRAVTGPYSCPNCEEVWPGRVADLKADHADALRRLTAAREQDAERIRQHEVCLKQAYADVASGRDRRVAAQEAIAGHWEPKVAALEREKEALRAGIRDELLAWVDERIEAEVTHRPDVNRYKRTLSETWTQVRNRIEMIPDRALSPPPSDAKETQPNE